MAESRGLSIEQVVKSFGGRRAVNEVSFQVAPGETVAIVGPSGCGKSTLLLLVAGLLTPEAGRICWDGVDLAPIPPHRRGFGLMFQDFALFPHRDVFGNVAFGLEMQRLPPAQVRAQVERALAWVGLAGFGRRDVNTLSGGEQQRVALARSLAPQPRLLMLDEPLGSLDRRRREALVVDLRELLQRTRQTALYVTHDLEEAFVLAERIVVMNAGRVEQIGAPAAIFAAPATPFVARFLGLPNLLPAVVVAAQGERRVQSALGTLPIRQDAPLGPATLLLRPERVRLGAAGPVTLSGPLQASEFRGGVRRITLNAAAGPLQFEVASDWPLPPLGSPLTLSFDPAQALQILPPESGPSQAEQNSL